MSPRRWPRVAAFGGGVVTAALTFAAVRIGTACYERAVAERSAATIAAYLSIAAPPDRSGSDYNLAQMLIQARAVATLIGSSSLEVYHRTAPLVHAVAPPLSPAELERLRREQTTGWDGGTALAPLLDREGWEVVGAVRVPVRPLAVAWLEWGLPALLLIGVGLAAFSVRAIGHAGLERRALVAYTVAALVGGGAAYVDLRTTARRATDVWLKETGALVQEATTHSPGGLDVGDVATIVRGGALVPTDVLLRDAIPRRQKRGAVAAVAVRMGGGRWAELRTQAGEAATGIWFLCAIGLALLGPAGVAIAARVAR
jgi:hypothetical protein